MKRAQYRILGFVVLLALALLNLPAQTAARLKAAVGSLFLPFIGLKSSSHAVAANVVDSITPRSELIRQNNSLRQENQQLRALVIQAQEQARENARLRELMGWQKNAPWKLRLGRVVARDPANWWRVVHIDLGSKDGLQENLPVLTPDGLVGRVGAVGFASAQVLLLGDPNCRVSALVENDRRDVGVICPAGPMETGLVELDYMPRTADIKPGQAVVTSGLGGVFPKGLPIGKIVYATPAPHGLHMQARVQLHANLSGLEEVFVLMP